MSVFAAEQSIDLQTPTGVIKGTLALPAGVTKPPVVLIIAGSGPTDRDGNSSVSPGKNDSLKLLAAALDGFGVASVRYDKRGVGASARSGRAEADLRFGHYVEDAAAWTAMLAQDARFASVTVLGHSEGALIGMLAAQRSPASAFISVAGAGEGVAAALRRQLTGRLPPDLADTSNTILASLEAGRVVDEVPQSLLSLYRPSVQPYLISWIKYLPADEIAKLTVPCLLLQGTTDIQVTVADAQKLFAANPRCVLHVIPGMNHVLKNVPADQGQQMASYSDPQLPLHGELVDALARFVPDSQVTAIHQGITSKPSF